MPQSLRPLLKLPPLVLVRLLTGLNVICALATLSLRILLTLSEWLGRLCSTQIARLWRVIHRRARYAEIKLIEHSDKALAPHQNSAK